MHIHIISIFPEAVEPYLASSVIGRAQKAGLFSVALYNPRKHTRDTHRSVDDTPYGGGPGMVMQALPILQTAKQIHAKILKRQPDARIKHVLFSPGGAQFDQKMAGRFVSGYTDIILICGRYEGVDARVRKALRAHEISIGPYVLSGGEIPALVVADAVARMIPGVLGNQESLEEKRVSSHEMYTKPRSIVWKDKTYHVPPVLLSGNHKDIEAWREKH